MDIGDKELQIGSNESFIELAQNLELHDRAKHCKTATSS
jgi:hypothetical protein